MLFTPVEIGQSNYFGFGFTTLCRKQLFVTGLCFTFPKNEIINQTKQFRHDGNQCYSLFQECNLGEKDWTVRIKEQLKKHFPKEEFYMVIHCRIFSNN